MLDDTIKKYILPKLKAQKQDENECRNWIVNLSQVAAQRKFVTHAPKFIHPDINCSYTPTKLTRENDGYIKTVNVRPYLDSIGNAARLPASEFMNLSINGKPLYRHLIEDTDIAKDFITFLGENGNAVKENFMKMFSTENPSTDSRVRQVFFPTGTKKEYHIITPLMSSAVMYELNETLIENNQYNNNPTNSVEKNPMKARDFEKKSKYLEGGYWTLFDTVNIHFLSSNPQNISSLNKDIRNFQLIKSLPPQIRQRKIRIPLNSFFTDSVYIKAERYSSLFTKLDRIFKETRHDITIRELRNKYMLSLLEEIATDIASVRNEIELNEGAYRGSLDSSEYIMLYENEKRYEDDEWLINISEKFSRWFFNSYIKIANSPLSFGDAEYRYVRDFVFENKEMFIQ